MVWGYIVLENDQSNRIGKNSQGERMEIRRLVWKIFQGRRREGMDAELDSY